jgi:hypothetical protein
MSKNRECALTCSLSPADRSRCPGVEERFIGPPTAASETVSCLVQLCMNPENEGKAPVFNESWDDGADTMTVYASEMPSEEGLHQLIDESRNI